MMQGLPRGAALALLLALTGCAGQAPTRAAFPLGTPLFSLPRLVDPPPASALPTRSAAGPASNAVAFAPASALEVAVPRASQGAAGGGSGRAAAAPAAPMPVIDPHTLDRVAGLPASQGPLAEPLKQVDGVAVDPGSGIVFASDPLRHQVRAIAPDGRSWIVAGSADNTTGFDGEGLPATASRLDGPVGLAFDVPSGALLVADAGNRRIRYFQPGGQLYTLAGGGADAGEVVSPATEAALGVPFGVAGDAWGHVWFGERDTGKVRSITMPSRLLKTVAQLPSGRAGALAVEASTGRVWVSDDHAVYLLDPSKTPALQAAPVFAPAGVRITAIAHDQRGAIIAATTSDTDPGTRDTRIWRVPLAPDGTLSPTLPVALLAGRGGTGAAPADYALPAATVPDATSQLLAGAGFCSLAVDWTHDLIYAATSYAAADPAALRAEVYRLAPRPE